MPEQENVDLIVVGSHGRHGFALLLGSTANSITALMYKDVRQSACGMIKQAINFLRIYYFALIKSLIYNYSC
ncbi:MAG: universal stress protein [Nitrosomonas sp.]|nr:universal stress protein [Nitrosomonas sp.]